MIVIDRTCIWHIRVLDILFPLHGISLDSAGKNIAYTFWLNSFKKFSLLYMLQLFNKIHAKKKHP